MRTWLENHLGTTMAIGAVAGILLPGLDQIPSQVIIALLAILIYLSCFRVDPSSIRKVSPARLLLFTAIRFLIVPLIIYFGVYWVMPQHALGALMLGAVPAGVSAPAFTGMFGGSVVLALSLVVVTNLLAPFSIPVLLSLAGYDSSVQIDTARVFLTLSIAVFAPIIIFALTRKSSKLVERILHFGRAWSVLLVSIIITLAIGSRRDLLLGSSLATAEQLFLSSFIFLLLFVAGWLFCPGNSREERIATSLSSGCNNAALGISISLLYLPHDVGVFLVLAEIPWIFGPVLFRRFLLKTSCSALT